MMRQYPYTVEVTKPLRLGTVVEVQGVPIAGANEFVVSLLVQRPGARQADIALQMKPQLNGSTEIGCVSIIADEQDEQINYFPVFPFSHDHSFCLEITVKESYFQISVDGKHLMDYSHRTPPHHISHVVLDGDAIFQSVEFFSAEEFQQKSDFKAKDLTYHERTLSSGYTSQSSEHNFDVESMEDNSFEDSNSIPLIEHQHGQRYKEKRDVNKYGVGNSEEPLRDHVDFEAQVSPHKTVFTFKPEERDITTRLDLPHFLEIPDEFGVGRVIYIDGVAWKDCKWFEVCLQTGSEKLPHTTAVFSFRPDFPSRSTTCNTFVLKNWGLERIQEDNFPFEAGKPFLMKILAKEEGYEVFVDGILYLEFTHRLAMERVTHVMVNGNADFYTVECPDELELPYCSAIPGGLHEGKTIFFTGTPLGDGCNFEVGLQCSTKPGSHIPFYFKVNFAPDAKATTASFINHVWDAGEKLEGPLPFQPDKKFVMKVVVEPECFRVKVDDENFLEFKHKLPYERITHVTVDGDLALYSVTYRDRWIGRRQSKAYHIVKSCCPVCVGCVIM
ncbi:uncharacterized protein LOC106170100 [Lingula anatina]|uniref:Uncharacterized protein LOC106170100 n=1 Tax=Lingula anatina TaxID=7574 RepID=A0A1S3J4U0_LINAN|nr:uncharacterized protein LOC106170100 [Lingula anatina]XP_013405297.1 uncharacterized protein LOC106170100 [Lingula anatina]XP_013405298.1 uncharacterized protein LOC106170100 [Lingula anatina]XP_013405299.1 uncharacterized protein LOC106170100 [Lingula anatina]|eukprot:XP_013405296.1 uncharacterized protein LOC106170100 [Lingula anatina]